MQKKKKRDLMPARIKRAKKELTELSHQYIRERDSVNKIDMGMGVAGFCCSCGKYCEGINFQAGHWEPDSTGGALLRFHPWNMNGQGGYCCNINRHGQQLMGINYTFFMLKKYGEEKVQRLRILKQRSIKADIIFYETMISLYKQGDEDAIVHYLEHVIH